ncbi:MAG: dehydrogenase [Planctomycetaceae bacterium]|nr:dehydrogenase [Planctomycetaceae bacterium]
MSFRSMMGLLLFVSVAVGTAGVSPPLARSDDKKPADLLQELPKVKPLEPAESLKAFDIQPGFSVELVASEPLIRSPVAMDFDENGRLFVAEFPEYNQYANPAGSKERGCIKMLESTRGDGKYDKATVYVDDLDSPVAVACWDGGVFVGVVPDLWYFKDTKRDGKADEKRKILTGFDRDKAGEGMLNSFHWGPDNRFHISTSLAGGNLRRADLPEAKPVAVRRQNILLDPRGNTFVPTSGGGQHGMTLDDWGDTFVCGNSDPIQHLAYDARYANRNPFVVAPSPIVDVNEAGRYPNLHRISPAEPWREARTRLRKDKLVPGSDEGGVPFGFFTGATGVTVYRGDAFPPEYRGNVFVGEIANNLVYRAKLEPKGLGWSAVRANKDREFLASKDIWFRPVQFANGPDGCLYVVDMYRELIEGAAFLPPQLLKLVNVAGGIDRGRIWRIVPEGFKQPKPPELGKATGAELVALLEHPNGWHRDTAARLLYQRQDKSVVGLLRMMAAHGNDPRARMHALYALRGLDSLGTGHLLVALRDREPRVREHALRLSEGFDLFAGLANRFKELATDPDPRVRYQLAFTLGSFRDERIVESLRILALKDSENPWVRLAVLTAAGERGGDVFAKLLGDANYRGTTGGKSLLFALAGQTAATNRVDEIAVIVSAIERLPEAEQALTRDLVQGFVAKLPAVSRAKFAGLDSGKAGRILNDLLADALKTAGDDKREPTARATAIRTLGLAQFSDVKSLLTRSLGVRQPQPVQLAALEVLAKFDSPEVPTLVLIAWPEMSPQIRATAAETLLARAQWVSAFLDAVEKGTVRPTDLDPARIQLLLKSPDEKVRQRATKLFSGAAPSKRQDVLVKYQKAIELKGDASKGKTLFKETCASCHKLEGVGESIGPDLASVKNRGTESVLTNIIDPNREVLPQYFSYVLITDGDVILTGMIAAETANTVTIRKTDGMSETVQRVNIASLRSTGLSAMPEGLEEKLDLQAMADLIAYLNSIK